MLTNALRMEFKLGAWRIDLVTVVIVNRLQRNIKVSQIATDTHRKGIDADRVWS